MRKAVVVFAAALFALPTFAEPITSDCIAPGCVITLKQRAQFIENPGNCEFEYIPGKANHGRVAIRGREEKFAVVRVEERDGEEFVIAENTIFFGTNPQTFSFAKIYLSNPKAFSISS
jgi:hypothetical protein